MINGKEKSEGKYTAKISNPSRLLMQQNAEVLLLALTYEFFNYRHNQRVANQPGFENAPPDFFQKGGWKN